MFKSIPGRFKDYISTPKPNLYRSLHTTVIGKSGIPFEVQIRTRQMHEEAEYGIAAHWKYKSGEKANADIDEKLRWIARLLESDESTRDPDELIHTFKTDIFHDETFVFTPKGDVISLPLGSTVIDFAYAIHSDAAILLHPDRQGLKSEVQKEGAVCCRINSEVPHELHARLYDICCFPIGLCIGYPVIALVRLGEIRELSVFPVKGPAVHNHAAVLERMPVHIF